MILNQTQKKMVSANLPSKTIYCRPYDLVDAPGKSKKRLRAETATNIVARKKSNQDIKQAKHTQVLYQ